MLNGPVYVEPPFDEMNDSIPIPPPIGTTTVPFGCTSGWPPITPNALLGTVDCVHVWPPSVERAMCSLFPAPASSHST